VRTRETDDWSGQVNWKEGIAWLFAREKMVEKECLAMGDELFEIASSRGTRRGPTRTLAAASSSPSVAISCASTIKL
jgi:hypothetical protein